MDGRELWRAVEKDPELEVVACVEGATPAGDHIVVRYLPSGAGHILPIREILRVSRAELFAMLKFERPARLMKTWNSLSGRRMLASAFKRIVEPSVERSVEPVLVAS